MSGDGVMRVVEMERMESAGFECLLVLERRAGARGVRPHAAEALLATEVSSQVPFGQAPAQTTHGVVDANCTDLLSRQISLVVVRDRPRGEHYYNLPARADA